MENLWAYVDIYKDDLDHKDQQDEYAIQLRLRTAWCDLSQAPAPSRWRLQLREPTMEHTEPQLPADRSRVNTSFLFSEIFEG